MLTLHRDIQHHTHADKNMFKRHPRRYRRIFFPPPKNKGGRVGVGARSSSSKNPQLPQQKQCAPGEMR